MSGTEEKGRLIPAGNAWLVCGSSREPCMGAGTHSAQRVRGTSDGAQTLQIPQPWHSLLLLCCQIPAACPGRAWADGPGELHLQRHRGPRASLPSPPSSRAITLPDLGLAIWWPCPMSHQPRRVPCTDLQCPEVTLGIARDELPAPSLSLQCVTHR